MPIVEHRNDGFYEVVEEEFIPMLMDVWHAGRFVDSYRDLQKRLANLERRGA